MPNRLVRTWPNLDRTLLNRLNQYMCLCFCFPAASDFLVYSEASVIMKSHVESFWEGTFLQMLRLRSRISVEILQMYILFKKKYWLFSCDTYNTWPQMYSISQKVRRALETSLLYLIFTNYTVAFRHSLEWNFTNGVEFYVTCGTLNVSEWYRGRWSTLHFLDIMFA